MTYVKQFDAIRAIAVILVIIWHWVPHNFLIFPLGNIGVDIFFVLSGFLITRILLLKKKSLEQLPSNTNKVTAIGKFMMRRSLRIFPIYYLMLLVLYFGASYLPNPMPVDWEYYALYVQNYLFYVRQSFPGGKVSPFWSLAVEEQFYLVWPWLLFYIPAKYIKHVLISGIIIGASCSFLFPLFLAKKEFTPVLTPACLQAFCLGGILSYVTVFKSKQLEGLYPRIKIFGLIAISIYIVVKLFSVNFFFQDRLLIALFTTWVLAVILLNKVGWFGVVLNNSMLVSIGKVSYGIYVYHNFIPVSFKAVLHFLKKNLDSDLLSKLILNVETQSVLFYLLCTLLLLFISFSSYYVIEKPLLSLKKYFD